MKRLPVLDVTLVTRQALMIEFFNTIQFIKEPLPDRKGLRLTLEIVDLPPPHEDDDL